MVPEDFKKLLANMELHELAQTLRDLAMSPQDYEYMKLVLEEIKRRHE